MAVEARHSTSFQPQLVHNNRQLMNNIDHQQFNMYGTSIAYSGLLPPLSGTTTTETFFPAYGTAVADTFPIKPPQTHTDANFTHNLPNSKKRSRDSVHHFQQFQTHLNDNSLPFLGEDISLLVQYQQFEIDNFIAQHTEKIRSEIEEHRKPNSRRIISAVQDIIFKKLRAKEEQLDKIEKLNCALQEKVKSLCIENQIWRDLAQSTEAAAAALRSNLEQVLRHRAGATDAADVNDDAQSCCGSNNTEDEGEEENNGVGIACCRKCGKAEACVLLLPCRHLCVCSVCGTSVIVCPVCNSTKNASLLVNMV